MKLGVTIRDLQPPPLLASRRVEGHELVLYRVTAALAGSGGGRRSMAGGGTAAADADTAAAADHATQELLVRCACARSLWLAVDLHNEVVKHMKL